jgi:hypothetical protein
MYPIVKEKHFLINLTRVTLYPDSNQIVICDKPDCVFMSTFYEQWEKD